MKERKGTENKAKKHEIINRFSVSLAAELWNINQVSVMNIHAGKHTNTRQNFKLTNIYHYNI